MSRIVKRRSRSRSRSRTPPVREKPKKIVNMLDSAAVSQAKEITRKPISQRLSGPNTERITCTIEGSGGRRSVFNRVSGGRFQGNRSFDGGDRRVNMRGDNPMGQRRSFGDRVQREDDDDFRRRREDGDKPVMKLVDPQEVPRSKRFFTHDDRGGGESNEWRGREMYDPRKDTGRHDRGRFDRFDRDRRDQRGGGGDYGRRDYGNREAGNRDYRRSDRDERGGGGRGGDDRRGGGGWEGFGGGRQNGFSGTFGSRSGVDGVWSHDKYMELEDETDEKAGAPAAEDDSTVLVVDTSKTERTVE